MFTLILFTILHRFPIVTPHHPVGTPIHVQVTGGPHGN